MWIYILFEYVYSGIYLAPLYFLLGVFCKMSKENKNALNVYIQNIYCNNNYKLTIVTYEVLFAI